MILLLISSNLSAGMVEEIHCERPVVTQSEGYMPVAENISRKFDDLILNDQRIRSEALADSTARFKIFISVRKHQGEEEYIGAYVYLKDPMNNEKVMTFLFKENSLEERNGNWLASTIAEQGLAQLKIEAAMHLGKKLSTDMFKNVIYLDVGHKPLEVKVLSSENNTSRDMASTSRKSTALHGHDADAPLILDIPTQSKYHVRSKPKPVDGPKDLIDIAPLQAEKVRKISHDPEFNFPKFRTSGFASLFLMPSLSWHQTHPAKTFSIESDSSWTREEYQNSNVIEKLKMNGDYYRQDLSLSTRLWERINLCVIAGAGQHQSDTQLDVLHPTAQGGTTFMQGHDLNTAFSDVIVAVNHHVENGRMIFRPGMMAKFPTGSTTNLQSSGHADYAISVECEYESQQWHTAGRISFVSAGDLAIFSNKQAELDTEGYVVMSAGLGRVLNMFGGEKISWVVNVAQNPLRSTTHFNEFQSEIVTTGLLLEKSIKESFSIRAEGQVGLTKSSPDSAAALVLKYSH